MRSGGGKAKGGAFERLVCERLSRWIDPDTDDAHVWRSAMSGGRATVRGRKGKMTKSQVGDLSATTIKGSYFINKFMVECKHIKNLKIAQALITGTGLLAEFWTKLRQDADHHGKRPMLIARQNGLPIIMLLRASDAFNYFRIRDDESCGCFRALDKENILIIRFDDFLVRKYIAW